MQDPIASALEVGRELRKSTGYRALPAASRSALDRDLSRIEATLRRDPYARSLDVADMERRLSGGSSQQQQQQPQQPAAAAPPSAQTAEIGARAAAALEAVDFGGFVATLITGTFRAIVDATAEQVRTYAELVSSISRSLEDFSSENVTLNQARDKLIDRHGEDLRLRLPSSSGEEPRVLPRPDKEGSSPSWLSRYDLSGEALTEELTEGVLLERARRSAGEEKLTTLATMVLMGINRIVVDQGDIRAKLQFHAVARDITRAEIEQQGGAMLARGGTGGGTQMMVSTVRANAQADAGIKADLMGEVRVTFRSETFPLERFADSAAIQLIQRHARWQKTEEKAPAAAAPANGTPPGGGTT